jgi:hypothetical protein
MTTWRIDLLKKQLREGPLSQRGSFAYIVATMLLYAIAVAAAGAMNAGQTSTGLDWLISGLTIVSVGAGTYAAYRANGGAHGLDFASRYFALGWVLFVRLLVLLFLPAMVFVFALGGVFAVFELAEAEMERYLGWMGAVVGVVYMITYYGRLAHHLRQVATSRIGGCDRA